MRFIKNKVIKQLKQLAGGKSLLPAFLHKKEVADGRQREYVGQAFKNKYVIKSS